MTRNGKVVVEGLTTRLWVASSTEPQAILNALEFCLFRAHMGLEMTIYVDGVEYIYFDGNGRNYLKENSELFNPVSGY